MPDSRPVAAGGAWVLAGVLAIGAAAGCSAGGTGDTIADQARRGDSKGYLAGDGTIEKVAVERRGEPVTLTGTTVDGAAWSSQQARGTVLVLNVWGSWCPPCEAEMPYLQSVWKELSSGGQPVRFLGINVRESPQTASAAIRRYGLTYPSLADDGGRAMLALQGKANATPTTLVLDRTGRIAARVSGPVTGAATLRALVTEVIAEPGGGSGGETSGTAGGAAG